MDSCTGKAFRIPPFIAASKSTPSHKRNAVRTLVTTGSGEAILITYMHLKCLMAVIALHSKDDGDHCERGSTCNELNFHSNCLMAVIAILQMVVNTHMGRFHR